MPSSPTRSQLGGVYVCALIIDALAPTFNGTKDILKAFKVAAYSSDRGLARRASSTSSPMLMILSVVGLYSFYLLYLGLPRLMRSPEDQAIGYVGVTSSSMIVVWA